MPSPPTRVSCRAARKDTRVLFYQGSGVGGWSFYLKDGKLHYFHNYVRRALYRVS